MDAPWLSECSRVLKEGGRILDPFVGSGTTLVAAEREGYDWTGIEMTTHYAEIARRRLVEPSQGF